MKSYGWLLVVVLCACGGYLLWMKGSADVQTPGKVSQISEKELLSSNTLDETAQEELGEVHADCIWGGEAEAWLDSNRDGIRDPEEPPLSGIPFYIDDIYNDFYNVGSQAISDDKGEAELSVWLPGCPGYTFEVYVDVLSHYSLTTPARIEASYKGGEQYRFGFVYNLVATPPPPATIRLSCQSSLYQESFWGVRDYWDFALDGTLWVTQDPYDSNIVSFNPTTGERHVYGREMYGFGIVLTDIAVGEDGTVWLTSSEGVSYFDGKEWTGYGIEQGLPDEMVGAVEATPDGTVWFATEVGMAQYHPATGQWGIQSEVGERIGNTSYSEMTLTPDGSLWLVTNYAAHRLPNASAQSQAAEWITYYNVRADKQSAPLSYVDSSAIAPDGSLWITGYTHEDRVALARLVPSTLEWTLYTYLTTEGAMGTDRLTRLVVAQDGSVWIGTYTSGGLHLIPASNSDSQDRWEQFEVLENLTGESSTPIIANPDGSIEIKVNQGLHRCTVEE